MNASDISREPVKLKGKVKRLEYWIPHNPSITGGNIVGTMFSM